MNIKEFRKYLNEKYANMPLHKHYRYNQRTRGYGDYLYFQDKVRFDIYYNEYLENQGA